MKNITKLLTRSMMLIALSMLMLAKVGWSQLIYVEIGTGTTSFAHPFYAFYADNRDQFLYLKTEMSPTLPAGPIVQLGFNFSGTSGYTMQNFQISMAHTTNTVLSGGYVTGMTTVYSVATFPFLGNGWRTIALQNPFVWDGVQNLVIEICHDNPDAMYGTSHNVRATSTS
ncbi:MAG: hypothetical protein ABIK52_05730, partial [Bacteroidota bacterium]